ncbi:MAG: hypothetical protein R2685_03970 [Candidatus Nitrosocosmicus sp.]|nr:hypothetical protein [Candidatus Nitrosocosmicus sp.]
MKYTIINDILLKRNDLINLILITVFASLGVNLLASSAMIYIDSANFKSLGIITGGAIIAGSIIYFTVFLLMSRSKVFQFNGLIVVNEHAKDVIPINQYDYSEHIERYIHSAINENSDIKSVWNKSFDKVDVADFANQDLVNKKILSILNTPDRSLIVEATECYIIEKLSLHLSKYFTNNSNFKEKNLDKLLRNDLANLILENRFLSLFTNSPENREKFEKSILAKDAVYASSNGAEYMRLELLIPKNSKMTRLYENSFQIKTTEFSIVFTIDYFGTNTNLPTLFEKYYLEFSKNNKYLSSKSINLNVEISFTPRALITGFRSSYHHWLYSFIQELEEDFDIENFYNSLGWNNILPVFKFLDKNNHKKE